MFFSLPYTGTLKITLSEKSSGEHCALHQLRNFSNRRIVVKEPMKDNNVCDFFFMTFLTSHIIAASLKYL